jgi:hypothetical protein
LTEGDLQRKVFFLQANQILLLMKELEALGMQIPANQMMSYFAFSPRQGKIKEKWL